MKYTSLHEITNSVLLNNSRPVHYYLEALKHSSDCLRELQFDVIGSVRSKKLTVNEFGAVDIPCDYVDYVRIGTPTSGNVISVGSVQTVNRLANLDAKGNRIPYEGDNWMYADSSGSWVYPDGIHYAQDRWSDGFFVVSARNEIQFRNFRAGAFVILDYISDGSEVDNATKVDPYAQKCIESYVEWKMKIGSEEEYNKQYRILRGRKSDITPANVIRSLRSVYGKQA